MLLGWFMGALDAPAHYFKWGWLQISAANLFVIVLMLVIFVLALVIPFPKGKASASSTAARSAAPNAEDGDES
jgi:hypothetical protein